MASPDVSSTAGTAELDETITGTDCGRAARYWVDLSAGTAGWEQMDDMGGDFILDREDIV